MEDLVARAPHAMAVTRGPTHVLREVNAAFCRVMNRRAEEVLGRPYAEAFPEPAGEGPLALLDRVLRSGEAVGDEELTRLRDSEASAVWSYTVWPLGGPHATGEGLVVEVRDRTHEVESTRRLQAMAEQIRSINERLLGSALREQDLAEKAEAAARAKADFLAVMSHELRTPLSGIVGYTEVLLGGIMGPITERQNEGLQRISACSDQLLTMIDDVLSYAQAEAQSVELRPERVDLHHLIREVAAMIEPLAMKKGLELRVEVPAEALVVETDPQKVRQILMNLGGNAVKFTDEGVVRMGVWQDEDEIRLWVRDTGMGIAREDLDRIFDPFVQSEAVLTRRFGGTGLGLPISRNLASLLGGTLTAESNLGAGSVFTVHLPRSSPGSSAPAE